MIRALARRYPILVAIDASIVLVLLMMVSMLLVIRAVAVPYVPPANIGPPPPPVYPAPESQLLLPSDFEAAAHYIWRYEPVEPTILRVSDYGEIRNKREKVFIVEFKTWKGERKAYAFYRSTDRSKHAPENVCIGSKRYPNCLLYGFASVKSDRVDDETGQNLSRADGKWVWRTEPRWMPREYSLAVHFPLPEFQNYFKVFVSPNYVGPPEETVARVTGHYGGRKNGGGRRR